MKRDRDAIPRNVMHRPFTGQVNGAAHGREDGKVRLFQPA